MFSGSKPPLVSLIDSIHEQKNIPRHILVDIVKQAMIKAAQEQFGRNRIIDAEYNEQKGEVDLYEFKTVVEEIEDDETEILLDDARQLNASIELGDSLGMPLEYDALGRIPAQKAKQVLYQRIREAERDMLFVLRDICEKKRSTDSGNSEYQKSDRGILKRSDREKLKRVLPESFSRSDRFRIPRSDF